MCFGTRSEIGTGAETFGINISLGTLLAAACRQTWGKMCKVVARCLVETPLDLSKVSTSRREPQPYIPYRRSSSRSCLGLLISANNLFL
jgi:hypothetical protein